MGRTSIQFSESIIMLIGAYSHSRQSQGILFQHIWCSNLLDWGKWLC
jgi:hypothetical protein